MNYRSTAVLPTGETLNPANPEGATYFDTDQVAYVVRKQGKERATRVLTSFGDLGDDWAVGTIHSLCHDQTGSSLGTVEVVGIAVFANGDVNGEVPDRKLSHSVFK